MVEHHPDDDPSSEEEPGPANDPDGAHAAGAPRRRGRVWMSVVVGAVVVLGFLAWAGASLLLTQVHAKAARDAMTAAQPALMDGDADAARASLNTAKDEIASADGWSRMLPLRLLSRVPWIGTTINDTRLLLGAAGSVADGALALSDVAERATDPAPGQRPLLSDGRIDLEQLDDMAVDVGNARDNLFAAVSLLEQVRGTGPAGGMMTEARDAALEEGVPLLQTLDRVDAVLPLLPGALGADGPRTYLVPLMNPAELFGSGGAALGVTVVTVDDGRIEVADVDDSGKGIDGDDLKVWEHRAGMPFFSSPTMPAAFPWAHLHPDFRISGYELAQAWQASTGEQIDGVVALDINAIADALRAIGDVEAGSLGTVSADNAVRKVLVDSYRDVWERPTSEWETALDERRQALRELLNRVLQRAYAGSGSFGVMTEIATGIPARHVQLWFADPALQAAVERSGASGALNTGRGDHIAVFTHNGSASKNDVFQRRTVEQEVRLSPDGGADVVRTTTVHFDTPDWGDMGDKIEYYYFARWTFDWILSYLPLDAEVEELSSTGGSEPPADTPVFVPAQYQIPDGDWPDGLGGRMVRTADWAAPQGTIVQTLRYRIPAGTFSEPDGSVRYRVTVDPQPFAGKAAVSVTVTPPDGWSFGDGSGPDYSADLDQAHAWSTAVLPPTS